jgi:orotidine-5'-phosphate decarboxylase
MASLRRESRFRTTSKRSLLVGNSQNLSIFNCDLTTFHFYSGKEMLEELKKIKKKKEPLLTAEEKASK